MFGDKNQPVIIGESIRIQDGNGVYLVAGPRPEGEVGLTVEVKNNLTLGTLAFNIADTRQELRAIRRLIDRTLRTIQPPTAQRPRRKK